jgi:predicted nucleic acid-binding Zn ribbon protein
MPTYVYACPEEGCENGGEVFHAISEIDNPKAETMDLITCREHGCRMNRVPQASVLMGFMNGTSVDEKTLLDAKVKAKKERSRLHFKNDVLPTLPKQEQKYFGERYKNLKGDHEKLK